MGDLSIEALRAAVSIVWAAKDGDYPRMVEILDECAVNPEDVACATAGLLIGSLEKFSEITAVDVDLLLRCLSLDAISQT